MKDRLTDIVSYRRFWPELKFFFGSRLGQYHLMSHHAKFQSNSMKNGVGSKPPTPWPPHPPPKLYIVYISAIFFPIHMKFVIDFHMGRPYKIMPSKTGNIIIHFLIFLFSFLVFAMFELTISQ